MPGIWRSKNCSLGNGAVTAKGQKKTHLEEMKELAERRGGVCLSDQYVNTDTKLLWQCSQGHQWLATPIHILTHRWCRICANDKQRKSIADMQALAAQYGGRSLPSL